MSTGRVVLVVGAILTGWESVTRLSDDCGEVEGKVSLQLMCCCSVLCCVSLTSSCSNSFCSNSRSLVHLAYMASRFHRENWKKGPSSSCYRTSCRLAASGPNLRGRIGTSIGTLTATRTQRTCRKTGPGSRQRSPK